MTPELVIFDCDGVLVDSEPISIGVLREILGEAGLTMDEATAYRCFLGRSMKTIVEMLHRDFGTVMSDAHLAAIRSRLYQRLEAELTAIPGVAAALPALGGVRRCVASSSQPERIRLSLRVAGLLEMLEPHIYSATMVERGKPAPDLFLHAARQMRVHAGRCVVIEDSPPGISAAKRAGMRVFAFTGGLHAGGEAFQATLRQLEPDLIFDDMRRLPQLLGLAATVA